MVTNRLKTNERQPASAEQQKVLDSATKTGHASVNEGVTMTMTGNANGGNAHEKVNLDDDGRRPIRSNAAIGSRT